MVILRKVENEFFISKMDNIIHCDLEKCTEQILEIPEPILPENLTKGQMEVLKKEMRTVTSLEFSKFREYIVVSTENKQIIVYDKHFNIVKNIIIHRAASKACFTTSNDILVADKTGDVYLYKISNEDDGPILLLGHLSVILDMQISECGKYLITCDRDEKIRVSHFPNCYNIASYCLGHTEFITRLVIVEKLLISASGDGTVRFWDFIKGKQLGIINTHKHISNKSLLEDFCLDMDKEKVEISALPITDVQVCSGDKLLIAVSVHRYNAIQLFSTDLNNFESHFIAKLCLQDPFVFCFSNNELYILGNKLSCFQINDNFDIVEKISLL
ncbi:tRNA (guanine-N(7)-)-methyltransferase non-catalytic subunit wuho [Leptinotarsa decemlineata]|uniref:tRNA (guanine-N(7)-)-methyltransferase non-catalytic subunit wuho n=1 Tax=Leptinotarsa decemlineata TaxID=7539 RepID=UPI003D3091F9